MKFYQVLENMFYRAFNPRIIVPSIFLLFIYAIFLSGFGFFVFHFFGKMSLKYLIANYFSMYKTKLNLFLLLSFGIFVLYYFLVVFILFIGNKLKYPRLNFFKTLGLAIINSWSLFFNTLIFIGIVYFIFSYYKYKLYDLFLFLYSNITPFIDEIKYLSNITYKVFFYIFILIYIYLYTGFYSMLGNTIKYGFLKGLKGIFVFDLKYILFSVFVTIIFILYALLSIFFIYLPYFGKILIVFLAISLLIAIISYSYDLSYNLTEQKQTDNN